MDVSYKHELFSSDPLQITMLGFNQLFDTDFTSDPTGLFVFDKPLEISRSISLGKLYEQTYVLGSSIIPFSLIYIGFEDVTVAAGHFENCLVVFIQSSDEDRYTIEWRSGGIGMVKELEVDNSGVSREITLAELREYSIAGNE